MLFCGLDNIHGFFCVSVFALIRHCHRVAFLLFCVIVYVQQQNRVTCSRCPVGARPPAECQGLVFSSSRTIRGWQGCTRFPRRTESKDLNSSGFFSSACISFPPLSMAQLPSHCSQIPLALGNMATGVYKFHTSELSWMKNMVTFSVQVQRNLQKILSDKPGSVAHCQMISCYHAGCCSARGR